MVKLESLLGVLLDVLGQESSRHVMARLVSIIMCASIVTTMWTHDGSPAGQYAFLALTYRELAFPPGPSLGTHLETSITNFIAISLAIVHSNIGKLLAAFVTRRYGPLSTASRAIPATFLVMMALAAGAVKSAFPRLAQSCRMACITAVFLLTAGVGDSQIHFHAWTDFLVVSATAACTSLLATALFLRQSSQSYPHLVVHSLAHLRQQITLSVDMAFRSHSAGSDMPEPLQLLDAPLLVSATQLHRAYTHAFFEPRYSRLHIEEIHPFVHLIERLRSELSWGSTIPVDLRTPSVSHMYSAFEAPSVIMTDALCDALQLLEYTINYTFDVPLSDPSPKDPPNLLLYTQRQRVISEATRLLKLQLGTIHGSLDHSRNDAVSLDSPEASDFSKKVFAVSLFTVSLLQIASDLNAALKLAQSIIEKFQSRKRRRLWLPKLTKAWFSSSNPGSNYDATDLDADEFAREFSHDPSPLEQHEDVVKEEREEEKIPLTMNLKNTIRIRSCRDVGRYLKGAWASILEPRIRLSKLLHSLKHSAHPRYAFKNAVGVAFLSLPAFLPESSDESHWFRRYYANWIVVTYIFVLETNTGATIRIGGLRLIGTFCGVILGYMAWVISRQNPFALVVMITLSDLPISWLILRTSVAPIGVVASVTIPPVLYTNLQRVARRPVILLAVNRGCTIAIGIVAAVLMNHFIFPRHCRLIFLSQTSKILGKFNELYISLSRQIINCASSTSPDARRTMKLEDDIRTSLFRANAMIDMMHLEICILPKPLRTYRSTIQILQRCLDLLVGLRRIRERIPKKETVSDVMSYRRDLISCICISLFACEATFRTGERVPQFLPSPQHALVSLIHEKAVALHLGTEATTIPSAVIRGRTSLSMSFALAENALLEELVSCLERLLDTTRKLYGTVSWVVDVDLEGKYGYETPSLPHPSTLREGPIIAWSGPATPLATPSAPLSPTPSLRHWM